MNIFGKSLTLILLTLLAVPSTINAMPSFFGRAVAYAKEYPYLSTGIALGLGGGLYYAYKLYCKAQLAEAARKAAKKIADEEVQEERRKKEEADEATRQLQEHLDGPEQSIARYLSRYEDLLERGANPNTKGGRGTILTLIGHLRSKYEPLTVRAIFDLLVQKKADFNIKDTEGFTALMNASCIRNDQIVYYLLKNGANPNIQNEQGLTALMCAIKRADGSWSREYMAIVKDLLDHGADPNIQDMSGRTALMHICEHKQKNYNESASTYASLKPALCKTIILLLKHGADLTLKNKDGLTALDFAHARGDQEMVDLLTNYLAHIHFKAIENDQSAYVSLLPHELKVMASSYLGNILSKSEYR